MDSNELIQTLLPLHEPTFFILLSLALYHKHGYAILKDVEGLSHGKIRLSTSTLYEALARLLDQGLIERVEDESNKPGEAQTEHPGKPRKAYRLTPMGRKVMEAEIRRMQALVSAARRQLGEENS